MLQSNLNQSIISHTFKEILTIAQFNGLLYNEGDFGEIIL